MTIKKFEQSFEKEKMNILPVNLQTFAGDGDGDGDGDDKDDKKDDDLDNKDSEDNKDDDKSDKTFTQSQLNDIVARETKKAIEKANGKLLSDLGFDNLDNAKDKLSKYKEFTDSQKTDDEKRNEYITELEEKLNSYESQFKEVEVEKKLREAGITDANMVKAKKYMNKELETDDAIKELVEDMPSLLGSKDDNSDKSISKKTGKKTDLSEHERLMNKYKLK